MLRVRARYQYVEKEGEKKRIIARGARARSKKTRELLTAPQASLSLSRGGHGGGIFFNLGPEKQKLRVVRYIYVYVRM